MFRVILCPIDFSRGSERALELAIAWAEREKSSLELLHVLEPPIHAFPGDVSGIAADLYGSLSRELDDLMAKRLTRVRERLPTASGVVVRGQPYREILARADALGADLLVMGTSGLGVITRAILGSVADRVLRSGDRPLLLVPEDGRPVSLVPKVIVASTDFSLASQRAVARTVKLAHEVGASVELVHAFEIPPSVERDARLADGLRRSVDAEMAAVHEDVASDPKVQIHARKGAPAPTIVALSEEVSADLVSIASVGRGLVSSLLLGGVTDRVARMSHVPVLVLRP
jgi:nucleotide-binding universal stress UspA family protein